MKTIEVLTITAVLLLLATTIETPLPALSQAQVLVGVKVAVDLGVERDHGDVNMIWIHDLEFRRDGRTVGGPWPSPWRMSFMPVPVALNFFTCNAVPNRISFTIHIMWELAYAAPNQDYHCIELREEPESYQVNGNWPGTYKWSKDGMTVSLSDAPPYADGLVICGLRSDWNEWHYSGTFTLLNDGRPLSGPHTVQFDQEAPNVKGALSTGETYYVVDDLPALPDGISFTLDVRVDMYTGVSPSGPTPGVTYLGTNTTRFQVSNDPWPNWYLFNLHLEYNPPGPGINALFLLYHPLWRDVMPEAPQTMVDPIVDGSKFSFPSEYDQALSVPVMGGTIFIQHKYSWRATSVQTGSSVFYPGRTHFELRDRWSATTAEINDYDFSSRVDPITGENISLWIFAGDDDPDDTDWIGDSGLGYTTINDIGFLVRKNNDPETDVHWFPGQPEPGDPEWEWDDYYFVFARAGFGTNEVYEIAYHSLSPLNIPPGGEIKVGDPEETAPWTVDPAWCYDTSSGQLISNVFDTLLRFDCESVENYIPSLATEWAIEEIYETSPEGLGWYYRYTFEIREDVKYHGGAWGPAGWYTVEPADVEYSFERAMVLDAANGPQWMFYEPLLDTWSAYGLGDLTKTADIIEIGKMIDHAVESDDTHVWFNLAFPGAYTPLLQILCQPWSSILSKQWVNDYVIETLGRPDWNGEWGDYTEWIDYHDIGVSPLDYPTPVMCGSGPFQLYVLEYAEEYWSVVRFPDYWRGWPADFPKLGSAKPAGYVEKLTVTWAYDWETRCTMFLAGDMDFCSVPSAYRRQMLYQPGIRFIYPLPTLSVTNLFFQFNIDPTTPYCQTLPAGTFDETGIPIDFFGNPDWGTHVRKGFAYCIDFDTYIYQVFGGEGAVPATAIIPGLLGYDPSIEGYSYNLAKAEEHFKSVPGLWETGFSITIPYYTGSYNMQTVAEILEASIEALNPKFHVTPLSLDWASYLRARTRRQLPYFTQGWIADYPDPHDFVFPFYASDGYFSGLQEYSNPEMDALIDVGIRESDPWERTQVYRDIALLAIEDCPSVPLYQPIGCHFERSWVCGWHYNPIQSGIYAYNLWKWYYIPHALFDETPTHPIANYLPCDVNYDGVVSILDVCICCVAFGASYGPPIHPRWQFRADIDGNRVVNIIDLATVAAQYGKTSPTWKPP